MHTLSEENIYNSKHLNIKCCGKNSLFIQEWNHENEIAISDFKSELLKYKALFKKHKPKATIWLQEGFTTDLKVEDHLWIEKNINLDCLSYGLEKCAFVVGKDVMAHLSVFNYFEELKSCIDPKHFAGKQEALDWVLDKQKDNEYFLNKGQIDIKYLGKTESGKSQYTLETNSSDTEATLKSFKSILKENEFLKENAERFYSLTQREKEIFERYAKGIGIREIAEELFLSEFTVRTHWRNAKKKLAIKSLSDISDYRHAFLK